MKKTKITAVSIRADRAYMSALRQLAREKKMQVGDLVRAAIDAMHGHEIMPLVSFFENRVQKSRQSSTFTREE